MEWSNTYDVGIICSVLHISMTCDFLPFPRYLFAFVRYNATNSKIITDPMLYYEAENQILVMNAADLLFSKKSIKLKARSK